MTHPAPSNLNPSLSDSYAASSTRTTWLATRLCHDTAVSRPMRLLDLAERPRMFSPQLAPDGRTLAYFASAADWRVNRLVFHLWRQRIGSVAQQLTFGLGDT